jgi:23S rRNA (uracil1939-C5)-methyltransferase
VVQHLSEEAQRTWKTGMVRETLRRLGGLADAPVVPMVLPPTPWKYRNKIALTFAGQPIRLGYRRVGGGFQVVEHCHLAPDWMQDAAAAVEAEVQRLGGQAWHPGGPAATWRKLVLREGSATGQRLLMVLTTPDFPPPAAETLGSALRARLGDTLTTALHGVSGRGRDTDQPDRVRTWWGPGHIVEEVAGLRFRISPGAFFQVHTGAADHLVRATLAEAEACGVSDWLDLYCGAGTFTLPLARKFGGARGVEESAEALDDARWNAAANGLAGARFERRDLRIPAPELLGADAPAGVLADPPRSGLAPWMVKALCAPGPVRHLLLVSCDPGSLARDLGRLVREGGWRLRTVRPFDLFPQTGHVESLARLERGG